MIVIVGVVINMVAMVVDMVKVRLRMVILVTGNDSVGRFGNDG